jgi:hypothetical protein
MTGGLYRTLLVLLAAECCNAAPSDQPKCVFSIEVVADSQNGMRPIDSTMVGDHILIFEYPDGFLTVESREGWRSTKSAPPSRDRRWGGRREFTDRIRSAFKSNQLNNLDFDASIADARIRSSFSGRGNWGFIGGTTVKVHSELEGSRFDIQCVALEAKLDVFSAFNPNLQKLKALLDAITYEMGRRDMAGLY